MIIVNFATKGYLPGQQRLANSINDYKVLLFDNYSHIGSPTHQESPYYFKIKAIEKAFLIDPIVVWMDASMYVVGDLSKIENIIKQDGYMFEEAGHYTSRWCNDFTKNYFKLTEQECVQGPGGMTLFSAGLLGLNRDSDIAMEFFRQWKASGDAGCFKGDWSNHRHEMTCASIVAQRLGMKYQRGGSHLSYIGPGYNQPEKDSVIYCRGI